MCPRLPLKGWVTWPPWACALPLHASSASSNMCLCFHVLEGNFHSFYYMLFLLMKLNYYFALLDGLLIFVSYMRNYLLDHQYITYLFSKYLKLLLFTCRFLMCLELFFIHGDMVKRKKEKSIAANPVVLLLSFCCLESPGILYGVVHLASSDLSSCGVIFKYCFWVLFAASLVVYF